MSIRCCHKHKKVIDTPLFSSMRANVETMELGGCRARNLSLLYVRRLLGSCRGVHSLRLAMLAVGKYLSL